MSKECYIDRNTLKCTACSRTGHVQKICIQTLLKQKSNKNKGEVSTNYIDSTMHDFYGINQIIDVYQKCDNIEEDLEKYYVDVSIEGKKQTFEVDSGTGFTLLPESEYHQLEITAKLQPTTVRFRFYTQTVFEPLGIAQTSVQYKDHKLTETLFIVPSAGYPPLLGRTWIRHLKINLAELDKKGQTQVISQYFPLI